MGGVAPELARTLWRREKFLASAGNWITTVHLYICVIACVEGGGFVERHVSVDRYTGCPRRNVPDFGRVFLMLKYTDITQNTYVQSWTVTEMMARDKCGLLAGPHTVPVSWQSYPFPPLSVVSYDGNSAHASHRTAVRHVTSPLGILMCSAWNPKDNYDHIFLPVLICIW